MAMKRIVAVDIDTFVESLKRLIGESEPMCAEDLFDKSGLKYEGIDKIAGFSKEILENLFDDQKKEKIKL